MFRRPKPGEDDLNKMMETFEKNSKPAQKSAETVGGDVRNGADPVKPKSVFARSRDTSKAAESTADERPSNELSIAVLRDQVVERHIASNTDDQLPRPPNLNENTAFPKMIRLESGHEPTVNKKSLFSAQFQRMKSTISSDAHNSSELPLPRETNKSGALPNVNDLPDRSCIVDGSGLESSLAALQIHQENMDKIQALTEEEILEEQEKLMQTMDPQILSFLTRKRFGQQTQETAGGGNIGKKIKVADSSREIQQETKQELSITEESLEDAKSTPEKVSHQPIETEEVEEHLLLHQYPNMNRDEPAKREWMADIAAGLAPGLDRQEGYTARFGFDGRLLAPDADVSVQSGLYHHGEEEGRAGYTFSELFTLVRSSNSRQRVVALETFSAILGEYWTGVLDSCFSVHPVEELVRCGFVSVLRSCLDEREESVVYAAAHCLASFLAPQGEEAALDWTGVLSSEQPGLPVPALAEEEEEEMKDHQLLQVDVIKGLLRMDILPRIRYILTVLSPGPGVVLSCLRTLVRIARHSEPAATQIVQCDGLLPTILLHFLPPRLPPTYSAVTLYGAPVWTACKLCRIICAWSRELAQYICSQFHLAQSLMAYLTLDPSEASIPCQESLLVCVESYRTAATLLRYGLATEVYTQLYPVLVRFILYYVEKVDLAGDGEKSQFNLDFGCALINLMTAVLGCTEGAALSWEQVADLRQPLETCTRKWLVQLSRSPDPLSSSAYNLVASALHFITIFYVKTRDRLNFNPDTFKAQVLDSFRVILANCVDSVHFRQTCDRLADFSGYLSGQEGGEARSLSGLPIPGAVLKDGRIHPVLETSSPVFFLSSLFRFISTLALMDIELVPRGRIPSFGGRYLLRLSERSLSVLSVASNWFSRYEARMLFWLLNTAPSPGELGPSLDVSEESEIVPSSLLLHRLAVLTSGLLQKQDEMLVVELWERVVFNDLLLRSKAGQCLEEEVHLAPLAPLSSPTNQPERSLQEILAAVDTAAMKSSYRNRLIGPGCCERSLDFHNVNAKRTDGLVVPCGTVLPAHWMFSPLKEGHTKGGAGDEDQARLGDTVSCLLLLLLAETSYRNSEVARTVMFYRLGSVFLSSLSLFLDPAVHTLLASLLQRLLRTGLPNLSLSAQGLPGSHEFYLELLDQYEAGSYGDQLFSLFILLPALPCQPPALRRVLWTEKSDLLRLITLRPDHMPSGMLDDQPDESNDDTLMPYYQSLAEKKVVKERNPLLHCLASQQLMRTKNPQFRRFLMEHSF